MVKQIGWQHQHNNNPLPTKVKEYNNPWWRDAACQGLDIDLFYRDELQHKPDTTVARMCYDCPVMVTCRVAGYGEYFGYWGNTGPNHRKETRHRIFRRLFAKELDADDDLYSFRRALTALIERGKDVLKSMREVGFNQQEIELLLSLTSADKKALSSIYKRELFTTTDYTYRTYMNGGVPYARKEAGTPTD